MVSRLTCFVSFIVVLGTLALLAGALHTSLFLDSNTILNRVSELAKNPSLYSIYLALTDNWAGPLGRPLSVLTLYANAVALPQGFTASVLVVNVLLHLLNAALVFFWLRKLDGDSSSNVPALFAASLWFLLPLHISTTLYAVQRMAILSALGVLLALFVYTSWRRSTVSRGLMAADTGASWLLIIAAVALATLSKENGVLALWLLLWVEIFFFKCRWNNFDRPRLHVYLTLIALLPALVILIAFFFPTDYLLRGYSVRDFSLPERVYTQLRVLWLYLIWSIVPVVSWMGLHHDDLEISVSLVRPWSTALAAAGWIVMLCLAFRAAKKGPFLAFAIVFYLVAHSLESTLLPLEMVFEHRNYLPSVAVSLVVVGLYRSKWLSSRALTLSCVLGFLSVTLLVALVYRTWIWSSEERRTAFAVAAQPGSVRASLERAEALEKVHVESSVDQASGATNALLKSRAELQRAQRLAPGSLVPPALLFLLDDRWFAGNPNQQKWLARALDLAKKRPLAASEQQVLMLLFLNLTEKCARDPVAAESLYAQLSDLAKKDPVWPLIKARCEASAAPTRLESRQRSLNQLAKDFPEDQRVLAYLSRAEKASGDDAALLLLSLKRLRTSHRSAAIADIKQLLEQ